MTGVLLNVKYLITVLIFKELKVKILLMKFQKLKLKVDNQQMNFLVRKLTLKL